MAQIPGEKVFELISSLNNQVVVDVDVMTYFQISFCWRKSLKKFWEFIILKLWE